MVIQKAFSCLIIITCSMYVSNLEVHKCEDKLIYMITITEKQNRETSPVKGKGWFLFSSILFRYDNYRIKLEAIRKLG